jgi:hypothetical protein
MVAPFTNPLSLGIAAIRANPPTCVIWPKFDVPNVVIGPMNNGSSNRFSTSTRSAMLFVPTRCVLEIARSVVRWPGPRQSGFVRGALPNVKAGAWLNAAGIDPAGDRALFLAARRHRRRRPRRRSGRCWLPSRLELLLDCEMLSGNPVW